MYRNPLEQCRLAEELGFDYAWCVEHHFLEEYSHGTAPELFLTAIAMQTRRIRVGHGAVVCFSMPERAILLVRGPDGLRLAQVEHEIVVSELWRGTPLVEAFDGAAFGEPRLRLSFPISAAVARSDVTFRPVRFACRADVSAFEGTETV